MGLSGKLVYQTEIKSCGDAFYELFRYKPHLISNISPNYIHSVELRDGEFGALGSVLLWNYFYDGKPRVSIKVIEAMDEKNRSVSYRFVEGDILGSYKSFLSTFQVDTKGEVNFVTWTMDYEKENEDTPEPNSLMDLCRILTKDIETHHLKK